jgi:hypothetical protein
VAILCLWLRRCSSHRPGKYKKTVLTVRCSTHKLSRLLRSHFTRFSTCSQFQVHVYCSSVQAFAIISNSSSSFTYYPSFHHCHAIPELSPWVWCKVRFRRRPSVPTVENRGQMVITAQAPQAQVLAELLFCNELPLSISVDGATTTKKQTHGIPLHHTRFEHVPK